MRILSIGSMYPPHHRGGYERLWQAVMRHAAASGHVTRVVTSDHRALGQSQKDDPGVHRTLRSYWDWERHEPLQLGLGARVRLERANAAELTRHLDAFGPDVVNWWGMGTMSLSLIETARRAGLPSIFTLFDDWLVYGPEGDQWLRVWTGWRRHLAPLAELAAGVPTRVDVSRAGRLVFGSRHTLERARRAGIDVRDAVVLHAGVDARLLRAAPAHPWRWRLLYVGRVTPEKGVDTAIEALVRLPADATLEVRGTGDPGYVAELRRSAADLGLTDRVRFAGFATFDDLPAIYAAADAVVFPSRWEEPFGLVPLEAMGVGRPVVSTAQGGSAEYLVHDANALVVEPSDPDALAEAVQRLAADEELRHHLREGGLRTASAHTLDGFAARMVGEIETTAARRAATSPSRR